MEIDLRGVKLIIDEEDYAWFSKLNWSISRQPNGSIYVQHWHKGKCQYLHRMLIDAPKGKYVDHIDRNTLNNSKSNLRLCRHRDNMRNTKRRKNQTGYRGVRFDKRPRPRPYSASAKLEGTRVHIGVFATAVEAAKAWDKWMFEHYPDTCVLNFPDDIV